MDISDVDGKTRKVVGEWTRIIKMKKKKGEGERTVTIVEMEREKYKNEEGSRVTEVL